MEFGIWPFSAENRSSEMAEIFNGYLKKLFFLFSLFLGVPEKKAFYNNVCKYK
jgi:hypothetical protein